MSVFLYQLQNLHPQKIQIIKIKTRFSSARTNNLCMLSFYIYCVSSLPSWQSKQKGHFITSAGNFYRHQRFINFDFKDISYKSFLLHRPHEFPHKKILDLFPEFISQFLLSWGWSGFVIAQSLRDINTASSNKFPSQERVL